MAEYDRRILVPYLQDVCSTELLCARLVREIDDCEWRIRNLNDKINRKIVDPQRPYLVQFEPKSDVGGTIVVIIWIAIFLLGGLWLWQWSFWAAVIPLFIATVMICGFTFSSIEEKEKAEREYNAALKAYEAEMKQNDTARKMIPQHKNNLQREKNYLITLKKRLQAAQNLLNEVYSVNIIASKYRNIHVAYYLYDYFSSCRERDLDKIIQTMLLDEIIQRLDKIILQNEKILLNQRIQIAIQEEQNRTMAEKQRKELEAIARMERNQELQLDYQHMIAKNQLVTNFLLAADYLYK